METKVNYPLVGGFVLVLGAALIAGVLWLVSGGGLQKKYDRYLAVVDESVAGLNLNAPVKYRGVDVGKVRVIKLDPNNPLQVQLVFAIEQGTPIKQDTVAMLKTQGLTGIAYVELDGGSPASPPVVAAGPDQLPVIKTKPSLSARLENVITNALSKLDSMSGNLNKLLSEDNMAALKSTLADLATVAHTVAARKDAIDASITSASRTLGNTDKVSAQLRTDIGPLLDRVGRSADALRKLGDEAASASATAGKTVESVGADVKQLTADTGPELQRLLGELNVLAASLRHLVEQTERNPRSLLFGRQPLPEGPGEHTEERARP